MKLVVQLLLYCYLKPRQCQQYPDEPNDETPVTIGYGNNAPQASQVMINLGTDIPDFASSFDRVVEIVGGNESNKQLARQRYRLYKEADYEIHDHKIENLTEND